MIKYLSCRSGVFFLNFKMQPCPPPQRSHSPITVKVGVNMLWLAGNPLVMEKGISRSSPIFF